jgi:hypothetical protein
MRGDRASAMHPDTVSRLFSLLSGQESEADDEDDKQRAA